MELHDITIYIQEIYRWPTLLLRFIAHLTVFIPLLSSFLSDIQRDRRTATYRERERQTKRDTERSSPWLWSKIWLSIHNVFALYIMPVVCLSCMIQTIHLAFACLNTFFLLSLSLFFVLCSDTYHDPSTQDTDCNFEQNLQPVVPGGRCASSIHCMEKKWCCCSK